jgi:Tol biopolymer transport system component
MVKLSGPKRLVVFASVREPRLPPHLFLMDTETGRVHQYDDPAINPAHDALAWSPDGRWFAFANRKPDETGAQIYGIEAFGEQAWPITEMEAHNLYLSPAGDAVAFLSDKGELYLVDLAENQARPLMANWNVEESRVEGLPSWSPEGGSIVFASEHHNQEARQFEYTLYRVNLQDGSIQKLVETGNFPPPYPAFSPDGRWIAYNSKRAGDSEIYIMAADGSQGRRLTFQPGEDFIPVWSPDGTRIAFLSEYNRQRNIHIVEVETGRVYPLTTGDRVIWYVAWSSDGRKLIYESYPPSGDGSFGELYTINADGGDERRLTFNNYQEIYPAWQP